MTVSVIIPVWNVEEYIGEAIRSVIGQTYQDIEVLIVDDCGTDRSIVIAESVIAGYSGKIRFRILRHEHNRGLSAARNTGIECASGEYMFFLDSDDVLVPDCIELLVSSIESEPGIQVASGNLKVFGMSWDCVLPHEEGIFSGNVLDMFLEDRIVIPVWNKLYRSSFIREHSLFFKEGLLPEDELWTFMMACNAGKMSVIANETYLYRRREGSIDVSTDRKQRNYNMSKIMALRAEYALSIKGMHSHKALFEYIESRRYMLFKEAVRMDRNKDHARRVYQLMRDHRYWTTSQIRGMKCSFGSLVRSLHMKLPQRTGFRFYVTVFKLFGI